jgi:dynein heavy chain
MMMHFHDSTSTWAADFFEKLGRKYYVTPTSYLEMIVTFKQLLGERQSDVKS